MKKLMVTVFAFAVSACAVDPADQPEAAQDEALVTPSPEYLAALTA